MTTRANLSDLATLKQHGYKVERFTGYTPSIQRGHRPVLLRGTWPVARV